MDLLTFDTLPMALQHAISIRELEPGQRLFRQGDPATALFIVEAGRFRLVRATINSNVIPLQFVRAGQSLGEAILFSDTYSYTAIAEVATQVIVYPKSELLASLHEHSDLAEDVINRLLQKISSLETNLELKGIRSAPQRILRYLQYLATPEQETVVNLEQPWKEVAAELGFTPDTLSRALAKLEQDGRISRTQQRVTLHNSSVA